MRNLEIERLRAVAILLVVLDDLAHLKRFLPDSLQKTGTGVDLFLVILGFVATQSLLRMLPALPGESNLVERVERSRPALAAFFSRRLHRVVPMALLWALIPLALAKWAGFGELFGKPLNVLKEVFAVLTLEYNYAYAYGIGDRLSSYWSLMVAAHFYLLLPFLLVLCRTAAQRMATMAVGIACVVFVLRPYLPFDGAQELAWAYRAFTTPHKLDALFAGALLCLLRQDGWFESFGNLRVGWAWLLVLLGIAGITTIQSVLPEKQFWSGGQIVLWTLSASLVLLASFERNLVLGVPIFKRVLEWLGTRSFGVFLIHNQVQRGLDALIRWLDMECPLWLHDFMQHPLGEMLAVLLVTFALAELCYQLIEQPLAARGRRVTEPLLAISAQENPQAPVAAATTTT
jgi:peptidoglycan/LPS O-acetylase OafA/YrhL